MSIDVWRLWEVAMRRSSGVWVVSMAFLASLIPASAATATATALPAAGPAAGPAAALPAAAAAPAAFVHPGVLIGRAQLDSIRAKVRAGTQPWKRAYDAMRASRYASLSRTAKPRATVECGPYSTPNLGCTEERTDALAAYTDALIWYITRDDRYAKKAIQLMDAWSATLRQHTNHNAPLQAGWSGVGWTRAGELIKHTYPGAWPNAGRFATMLRTVYLPTVIAGSGANGNWELIMVDAAIGISVFLDDRASFDRAVALWRGRVPAYIYLTSDGREPKSPPDRPKTGADLIKYWHGQTTFMDGLAQETCRDFGHTAMGFNAAFHTADTARLQGVNLWGEQRRRLAAGLEFHAAYELGKAVPSALCGGSLKRGTGSYLEPGYHALAVRLGVSLPNTKRLIESRRPMGTDDHSTAWETLTSA